jgi:hypothetical protein
MLCARESRVRKDVGKDDMLPFASGTCPVTTAWLSQSVMAKFRTTNMLPAPVQVRPCSALARVPVEDSPSLDGGWTPSAGTVHEMYHREPAEALEVRRCRVNLV